MLKLTYFGHACFALEAEGYRVLLDPYSPDYVPGLGTLEVSADKVLCSHDHADHSWKAGIPAPLHLLPDPFTLETVHVFHDDQLGSLRGLNTIHILEYKGLRVAHFGDLGHDLDDDQIEELGRLDVALIPVGGTYTLDCQQASDLIDRLQVKTVVPMHYRRDRVGFEVLQTLQEFLILRPHHQELPGNTLEITDDMPETAVVLQVK